MSLTNPLTKCLTVVLSAALVTQSIAAQAPNVKLTESKSMTGFLVSPEGQPLAQTIVKIRKDNRDLQAVKTNEKGEFEFQNLTNGTYELQGPKGKNLVRAFESNIAPENAKEGVLLVNGEKLLRGGPVLASGPLAVIGLVAVVAAAAIIIAEEADDDDGTP